MRCPRCGEYANEVASEPGAMNTRRRQYVCMRHHRFATVEVWEPQGANVARTALSKALRAIYQRITTAWGTA